MSSTNQFPQGDPLLPTPRALDASGVRGRTPNRTDEANARAGESLTDVLVHQAQRQGAGGYPEGGPTSCSSESERRSR
jgi:hypothetical protein